MWYAFIFKRMPYVFKINFWTLHLTFLKMNAANGNEMFETFSFFSFHLTNLRFNLDIIQKIQHHIFTRPDEGLLFKNRNIWRCQIIQTINEIILRRPGGFSYLYIFIYIYIYIYNFSNVNYLLTLFNPIIYSLLFLTAWERKKILVRLSCVQRPNNITGWNDKIVAQEKTWFHFRLMKTGFLFLLQTIH